MRYTTLIDIRDFPTVWRNNNTTRLYVHMVLACGFHDEDRDQLKASVRGLAASAGLTVAAVRNGLAQLIKAGLVKRNGDTWTVVKWVAQTKPTPRQQAKAKAAGTDVNDLARREEEECREFERQVIQAVADMTVDEVEAWVGELKEGRSLRHRGLYVPKSQGAIKWMEQLLNRKKNETETRVNVGRQS